MEPLDTDFEYVVRERKSRSADSQTRFNWLLVLPALGVLWLLFLIGAALFQWPISDVVGPVMTLMIVLFFVMIALLFWALAPRENR